MKRSNPLLEHAIDVEVSLEFIWNHRTDITNWNDPPAQFTLDGPFVNGAHGSTVTPGQEPMHWTIRNVVPQKSFGIEMQLDGAVFTSEWRFEYSSKRRTRMTQRLVLSGANAAAYAEQIEAAFKNNLAEGMKRIAREIEAAEQRLKTSN